ncbi:class I SAM-dependent methyltransferase [Frankia sp. Cj3]|uniref:class I SAM-dependent methyltransferase n=1 Tax=Frankia sp. Cj3 TaxID=2880976 RepID=UPI001EF46C9D|nr:class I SAM-dependent methyltransferase [Frankia sp. Cj3]
MHRRTEKFGVTLTILDDLLTPLAAEPREFLLNRALDEFVQDVAVLDGVAATMVTGAPRPKIDESIDAAGTAVTDSELIVSGQQVMQSWERPLMQALAQAVTTPGGSVLEVGFGLAISAGFVQEIGPAHHTIIGANPEVARRGAEWVGAQGRPGAELVHGKWQDVLPALGRFDGILFDTYPLDEGEFDEYVMRDATFAEHFFPHAAAHLRDGGAFTYYSNEIDSMSRRHQRALLEHFRSFSVRIVDGLRPPPDCHYWWAPSMAVIVAREPRR